MKFSTQVLTLLSVIFQSRLHAKSTVNLTFSTLSRSSDLMCMKGNFFERNGPLRSCKMMMVKGARVSSASDNDCCMKKTRILGKSRRRRRRMKKSHKKKLFFLFLLLLTPTFFFLFLNMKNVKMKSYRSGEWMKISGEKKVGKLVRIYETVNIRLLVPLPPSSI